MKFKYLFAIAFTVLATATLYAQDSGSTASSLTDEEIKAMVDFHNKARKEVGCPPVEWSPVLAGYAQEWANELARQGCRLQHRPSSGKWAQKYGENIFWGGGAMYQAIDAAKSWYSEKKYFKGGKLSGANWSKSGHYTQMVWRKTTALGCGIARCKNGAVIVVGNYDPAGNMMGEKAY